MDSIESVMEDFNQGRINMQTAINRLAGLAGSQYDDDEVRNGFIVAMLRNLNANGVPSDQIADFVWDVAQRLMSKRAKDIATWDRPQYPIDEMSDKVQAVQTELDADPSILTNMALDLTADQMNEAGAAMGEQANKQNNPWPVTGTTLPPVAAPAPATWGGGAKFGDGTKAQGEHDDGPF